jgi:hypothetical protein
MKWMLGHKPLLLFVLVFSLTLLATACSGDKQKSPAAKAVEDYWQAMVSQNSEAISALSCPDWESQAIMELDSFQAVKARVDGMNCAESGKEGSDVLVKCQGKIIATYGDEDQELSLDARAVLVRQDGGEWLVCGYR